MAETRVTSIRLPKDLLEKAQEIGLNVSKVCENCLREAVRRLEGYTAQTETNGGYTDVRSTSSEERVVARGRFELPSAGPKPTIQGTTRPCLSATLGEASASLPG